MDTLQLNLVTESVNTNDSIRERKRNLEHTDEEWDDGNKNERTT